MALTVNFSTTQTIGAPDKINFLDDSTGIDATISQRRIYLQTSLGTYLVEDGTTTDYEVWSGFPGTTTITLDVLDKDYALNIQVDWLTALGVVVYTKTTLFQFSLYNKTFFYGLTQDQSSTPVIVQDTNYYNNKGIFWVELIGAENAVDIGGDIGGSQECLDRATAMRLSEDLYF